MLHNLRIIHISIDLGHKLTLVKTKHKQKDLHCLTILSHFLICCYAILFRSNFLHGNVKDCMPFLICTWFYMIFQTKSLCWFPQLNFKSTKPQYCPLIWMCLSICLEPCSKLAIFYWLYTAWMILTTFICSVGQALVFIMNVFICIILESCKIACDFVFSSRTLGKQMLPQTFIVCFLLLCLFGNYFQHSA